MLLGGALGRPRAASCTPLQLPFAAGDRWLGARASRRTHDARRRPAALHRALRRRRSTADAPQCGLLLDEWTEVIPAATETTGIAFHYDRPELRAAAGDAAGDAAGVPRRLAAGTTSSTRCTRRSTWPSAARSSPSHVDATPYAPFLPATVMAATRAPRSRSPPTSPLNNGVAAFAGGRLMAVSCSSIADLRRRARRAAASRRSRSGTGSRAGRARDDFDRALRAEVRDALWMLTRQWQLGEFRGDDAGSPVLARAARRHDAADAATRPRDGRGRRRSTTTLPLEAARRAAAGAAARRRARPSRSTCGC